MTKTLFIHAVGVLVSFVATLNSKLPAHTRAVIH